ncbi:MAG: shikimate dehydrogenase [Xanthomonadales bacterium]|nr:shikimate dehydrogenase [Xanthomonadales bacterium]
MATDQPLIRLALFGQPVKSSLSPRIHALFAEQAGLDVDYRATAVAEEFLSREIQALADAGARGCNITLPYKQKALALANRATDRAQRAAAANTLIFESRARWKADNTDGPGLIRDLTGRIGMKLAGERIALIGAGGAAAGILEALLSSEPNSLVLFNRTPARGQALAEQFSDLGAIEARSLDQIESAGTFHLVIHATSAGHRGEPPLLPRSLFQDGGLLYDLNYGLAHRKLAAWSRRHQVRCTDGLGMLVEQAAESFELWTGHRPDTDPVLTSIREGS